MPDHTWCEYYDSRGKFMTVRTDDRWQYAAWAELDDLSISLWRRNGNSSRFDLLEYGKGSYDQILWVYWLFMLSCKNDYSDSSDTVHKQDDPSRGVVIGLDTDDKTVTLQNIIKSLEKLYSKDAEEIVNAELDNHAHGRQS